MLRARIFRGPGDAVIGRRIPANAIRISKNDVPDGNADGDWYAVNLQAGQTLFVTLVADIMGSPYDGDIAILDAAGATLKQMNNWATGIADATLDYRAQATATYYIRVMSHTGANTARTSYKLYAMARNVPGQT